MLIKRYWHAAVLLALFFTAAAAALPVRAEKITKAEKGPKAEKAPKLSWELKFLLDSDRVTDKDHLLSKEYRNLFSVEEEPQGVELVYLDTKDRDFFREGWINRIRLKEGKKKYELDFKKRFDVPEGDIDAALLSAAEQGFHIEDPGYEAQADWGYEKMRLSFVTEEKVKPESLKSLSALEGQELILMAKKCMPEKEDNWISSGWGKDRMEEALPAGPLKYLKYSGIYEEQEIDIEIWPVDEPADGPVDEPVDGEEPGEKSYVTELSLKCDTREEAEMMRDRIMEALDKQGILLHKDSLKTNMILDKYIGPMSESGVSQ
ncbi:MAG: hypothetical protein IJT43_04135 [Stomatobaculum sp.]|nr:hypothetical protein [Stomatobaculum sp.]